jgi:hypothetical protein
VKNIYTSIDSFPYIIRCAKEAEEGAKAML